MAIVTIGIDLGKNVCSLAGLDEDGRVVLRKRMQRIKLTSFLTTLPPATVAMEACCGAHHVGQQAAAAGHQVRLMSPEYVRGQRPTSPRTRAGYIDADCTGAITTPRLQTGGGPYIRREDAERGRLDAALRSPQQV